MSLIQDRRVRIASYGLLESSLIVGVYSSLWNAEVDVLASLL